MTKVHAGEMGLSGPIPLSLQPPPPTRLSRTCAWRLPRGSVCPWSPSWGTGAPPIPFAGWFVTWVPSGRCVIVTMAAEPPDSFLSSQRHAEHTGFDRPPRADRAHETSGGRGSRDRQRHARRRNSPGGMLGKQRELLG